MNRCHREPPAVVLGAGVNLIEVVRSLALAGLTGAVVTGAHDAARLSRYATAVTTWEWTDPCASRRDGALVERLVAYARTQPAPPPLLFTSDEALLFACRHRDDLAPAFRFAIAEAGSVEAMADKGRFAVLAERLKLCVPPTRVLEPPLGSPPVDLPGTGFPLVVKPYRRDARWHELVNTAQKAVRVCTGGELAALWPRLAGLDAPIVLQASVPGPESRLESYHVYVDEAGRIAAEFAGRKIRTLPAAYGHTTALTITDTADVIDQGRTVVRSLGLRGVAKVDFKRAPGGDLFVLEVNPRFQLWHHAGARAGVNIPALVYADLTGRPRPRTGPVRDGVRWVHPNDLFSATAQHIPAWRWARWASGCEAKAFWAWNDPVPLAAAVATRLTRSRSR